LARKCVERQNILKILAQNSNPLRHEILLGVQIKQMHVSFSPQGWSILRYWKRLRRLSPKDRLVLVQAFGCSLVLHILLRILRFRRTQAFLLRLSPAAPCNPIQGIDVERVSALTIRVCGWRILRINCLKRSLILWWLLRRRGVESALRVGARQTTTGFEAHAWVEWNGQVLGDSATYVEQFAPFGDNFAKLY
jgi:hypothetical protein